MVESIYTAAPGRLPAAVLIAGGPVSKIGRPRGVQLPGLRDARTRRLMTQRRLSAMSGVSIHVVNRAEAGERVSLETAYKLAEVLRVRPDVLLGPDPAPPPAAAALPEPPPEPPGPPERAPRTARVRVSRARRGGASGATGAE